MAEEILLSSSSQQQQQIKAATENEAKCVVSFKKIANKNFTKMACICLCLVGGAMAFSLYSPFFPNQALRKEMGPSLVGNTFSCYELVMFFGTIISSKTAINLGIRWMLGSGTVLAAGSIMLFGVHADFSPHGSTFIILCFALRLIEATGYVLYMTATYCIAGKIFPNNIAFAYSVLETANGLGGMIGPTIGGWLIDVFGFFAPFITFGGCFLIFGLFTTCVLPASAVSRRDEAPSISVVTAKKPDQQPSRFSRDPWLWFYRVSFLAWIVSFSEMITGILSDYPEPTISIFYDQKLGLTDPTQLGLIFQISSIVYTISCITVGHLADRFNKHVYWIMASGALFTALSFFFMGPPPFVGAILEPSIEMTATAHILLYAGIAMIFIPVPRALLDIAKDIGYSDGLETSAMIAGLYNATWYLGGFVGSNLAGFLMEKIGFQWGATIMTTTALAIVPLLVFGAFYSESNRTKKQPPITIETDMLELS